MKITFNELWGDYTNLSKEDIQEHAEEIYNMNILI